MRKLIVFLLSVSMITVSALYSSPLTLTYEAEAETIHEYPDGDIVSNPFTFPSETETPGDFEFDTTTSSSGEQPVTTTTEVASTTENIPETVSSTEYIPETVSSTEYIAETDSSTEYMPPTQSTEYISETVSSDNNEASTVNSDETASEQTTKFTSTYTDRKTGAIYKIISIKKKTVHYTGNTHKKMTKAIIPDTIKIKGVKYRVTAIGSKALAGKKLRYIKIGRNIKSIKKLAFAKNKKLKRIIIKSIKLTKVKGNALKYSSRKVVIKVPKSRIKKYRKLFKNRTVK